MEKKERLKLIAQEYAKEVGELLGSGPEYWVAEDVATSTCCFGDVWFLDLEEMQVIIDHMNKWIEKYGSREKVGKTVIAWMDWTIEDNVDEMGNFRNHPRINLWSWLTGLRPDQLNRYSDIDQIVSLDHQANVLRYVLKTYPTSSIENAAKQIEARLKLLRERHEREIQEDLKNSEAYNEFMNLV